MSERDGAVGGETGQPDSPAYSRLAGLLLYFNNRRRKTAAVVVFLAGWIGLIAVMYPWASSYPLRAIPQLYFITGCWLLALLFSQGAGFRRPVLLPEPLMRANAKRNYFREQNWSSRLSCSQAVSQLVQTFTQPGVQVKRLGCSVWVELTRTWNAANWRHKDAVERLSVPPTVHFFVVQDNGGSLITVYSKDRRAAGTYDQVTLSDEMSETAVELARRATTGST